MRSSRSGNSERIGWDLFDGISVNFQQQRKSKKRNIPRDGIDPIEQRRKEVGDVDPVEARRRRRDAEFANCAPAVQVLSNQTLNTTNLNHSPEAPTTATQKIDCSPPSVLPTKKDQLDVKQPANWWPISASTHDSSKHESTDPADSQLEETTTKQRKAVYRTFGGVPSEYIRVEESEVVLQARSSDHVVVKILASSVTMADCLLRRGLDFQVTHPVSLPAVPGHDFVGTIVACGDGAQAFSVGDLVGGMVQTGGNARFISVPESSLIEVPHFADPAEAVCILSVYATAYHCMKLVASNKLMFSLSGKKVLILGGADGVSEALIELCKKAKAEIFVPAPERRYSYVRELGATLLPEQPSEWSAIVEREMDLVFDGICHNGFSASLKALNENGTLVCFGREFLLRQKMGLLGAPISAYLDRLKTELSGKTKIVDLWESYKNDPEMYQKNVMALFDLLRGKKIKPHVAKRISLGEVGLSHHKLETGQVRGGTIVCFPWKRTSKNNIYRVAEDR